MDVDCDEFKKYSQQHCHNSRCNNDQDDNEDDDKNDDKDDDKNR